MTEIATRPFPSALPPAEAELVLWRALSRDEQPARYREALQARGAGRVSKPNRIEQVSRQRQRERLG